MSNRSGIKYPRLRIFASKQNVNDINLYNNYTFSGFPGLLIFQILLAVSLLVSCALAVEALSFILGSALRVALGAGLTGARALLGLAFLFETGGFIHKQHLLAIFPQSSFRRFQHGEHLFRCLLHPIHVVVHDKTVARRGGVNQATCP